jgi:hypothetical protein
MQAITAGVLSALSDIVSQKLSGIQKLQIKRILLKVVQASFFLISLPSIVFQWNWLSRVSFIPFSLFFPFDFYYRIH